MNTRVIALGSSALAGALLVAGCGNSSSGGSSHASGQTPLELVAATADKTAGAKNAKLSIDVKVDATSQSVELNGDGVADLANSTFKLSFPLPAGSSVQGSIDEVYVNHILYLSLPEGARSKTDGKPWVSIDPKKLTGAASSSVGSYNQDPMAFLTSLKSVSNNVTDLGSQDVRGVHTTHYRADVDLAKAAKVSGASTSSLDQYKDLLGSTILPEDVYLDDQGRTRRVAISITPSPGSAAADSLNSESVTVDYYDFGSADTSGISAPPADQTVDFSQTELAG